PAVSWRTPPRRLRPTLSLHDALPIFVVSLAWIFDVNAGRMERTAPTGGRLTGTRLAIVLTGIGFVAAAPGTIWYFAVRGIARRRSEEHTSELQSRENLVCRLLLEKKH